MHQADKLTTLRLLSVAIDCGTYLLPIPNTAQPIAENMTTMTAMVMSVCIASPIRCDVPNYQLMPSHFFQHTSQTRAPSFRDHKTLLTHPHFVHFGLWAALVTFEHWSHSALCSAVTSMSSPYPFVRFAFRTLTESYPAFLTGSYRHCWEMWALG